MVSIPLAQADRRRGLTQEPDVLLRNRFVEANPVLSDNVPAFIQRPALRFWKFIGMAGPDLRKGPVRACYSAPGAFNDDLFVMAYNSLYRVDRLTGNITRIANDFAGGDTNDSVRMAATGDIGTITPRLWVADGKTLRVYSDDSFAQGHLEATAAPVEADVVRLGTIYYRFTAGSVDAGAPAGTLANPWRVKIGLSIVACMTNLFNAINDTGVSGTDYSTALVESPDALGTQATAQGLFVRAKAVGSFGNAVVTTETSANLSWAQGATLAAGGTPGIIVVPIPEGIGVLDVAVINNFVIIIPTQGSGVNGRFYWANPGEIIVDPLDFATAERSPDPVYQVVVFSDQFWLPGQSTTEVYYMSGNPDAPVTRFQGVVFDRGVHPGCALQVFGSMVLIDPFGTVFQVQGGEKKISTPDITEKIRKAIMKQNILTGV